MDFELKVRDETCLDVGRIGPLSPPVLFLDKEFFGPLIRSMAWKLGVNGTGRYMYMNFYELPRLL